MANENVTHAPFQRAQLGSMAEEIRTVIYGYANRTSVAQVLGHKTVQSTRRYAHLYPEAQSAALATIFRRNA